MSINNEADGIAAEVAICNTFDVPINPAYAQRADQDILNFLLSSQAIPKIFQQNNLPHPIQHIAEGQNPVDFILESDQTLSVKTNQHNIGKVAPQNIGQPSQQTFFNYLETHHIIPDFNIRTFLTEHNLPDNYESRAFAFKNLVLDHTYQLLNTYWQNTFECDYLLLFFNLEKYLDPLQNYRIFDKQTNQPHWDKTKFSFTRPLEKWNESSTLKYDGITIGEFQVHRNRDCFKFRFNMKGISKLLDQGLI